MQASAPAALTATAPTSAAAGAQGARLGLASDPTHLLTDLSLAEIRRLVAAVDGTAKGAPTVVAAAPAAAPPAPSPWAWLLAIWQGVASLYVALTEPQRRRGPGRA